MEALSPRDANAHIRTKTLPTKAKSAPAASAKLSQKEKDHPPPPPGEVREPPSSDRKNGAVYKTGKCLGKGGFAICYEGQLAGTKHRYALKIVKSKMPQKKMEQKFQTELQIHSKMNHINIVEFHRAFSYEQCTYIVLELCPNGSLMDMIKKRKYITEPEVRFWTVQISGAIKYMHSKGIIHRDLKMGNIFLDKDMNVKVGDFGLAALLMSGKDWIACRRTTLCGTPNYIAPEILSKDKGGHDHAVDIWSLGIIIFALLTGKPPFQSATADEIYRRARELEYDWPKLDTSENSISEEAKDLVTQLLVQEPENRPDPDTIVQHPFFTSGWVPQSEEMTPSLRDQHPDPTQFLSVGVRGVRTNLYTKNLKKLCAMSEVGPWISNSKPPRSTYRECADEEKAGLTPIVPLAEDIVYRPFHDFLLEQGKLFLDNGGSAKTTAKVSDNLQYTTEQKPSEQTVAASIAVPQSFAAQQRARPQGLVSKPPSRLSKTKEPTEGAGSRPLLAINPRSKSRKVEPAEPEEVVDVENRLAADLLSQLHKAEAERKLAEVDNPTISLGLSASIFNPKEKLEALPNTKPDYILESLHRFQAELERALNSRTIALEPKNRPADPVIVVKWVDYSKRYGLGYILSNKSIGGIFKATPASPSDPSKGNIPPCGLLIREAENHFDNRHNEKYADRHQLVPVSGPNIEFYENRGDHGVFRGAVNPQNFKAEISPAGVRLIKGGDEWDERKREKVIFWKKFANYMMQFGKDQDYPHDDALARSEQNSGMEASGTAVTFYQRWGDVACWGFANGRLQFNFPDHTKIVLSPDGTWCDFYHLTLEAARDFAKTGHLTASALDSRTHLGYPLQTLLNMMNKPSRQAKSTTRKRPEIDPMVQGIPEANDFRRKVEFILKCVKEWTKNGGHGISDMSVNGRLRWHGLRELVDVKGPLKFVWISIGGRGDNTRKTCWFDPRKQYIIPPDIEE